MAHPQYCVGHIRKFLRERDGPRKLIRRQPAAQDFLLYELEKLAGAASAPDP